MSTGGWITMILSVGSVCCLFFWCLFRVLAHNPAEKNVVDESIHAGDEE